MSNIASKFSKLRITIRLFYYHIIYVERIKPRMHNDMTKNLCSANFNFIRNLIIKHGFVDTSSNETIA